MLPLRRGKERSRAELLTVRVKKSHGGSWFWSSQGKQELPICWKSGGPVRLPEVAANALFKLLT